MFAQVAIAVGRWEVGVTQTVFGSYLAPLAAFTALGVIVAAIGLHVLGRGDQFIDELAFAAFGLIFGIAPGAAGLSAADAAHKRLDAIHAPAASDLADGGK